MKSRPIVPAVLLVIAAIVGSRLSTHFLNVDYLLDSSTLYMETGLLALAMTFIIISGNIDLSVASNIVLTACLTAKLMSSGVGTIPAVLFALTMGTALGAINGLLVAKLKLPSFLVTLGTMATYRGAAQAILGPVSVKLPKAFIGIDEALVAKLPWPLVVFLLFAVITGLILHRTVFGRWTYAVGTSESAATYSGVPVDRVKISVFAMVGFMAGVGALLLNSRLGVARYDLATGWELDAITVAVVGGCAITGGKGSIFGTVLATFLVMVMKTAMGVANVKAEYQLTVIGALLILTVLAGNLAEALSKRKRGASIPSTPSVPPTPSLSKGS
jgi:rhamnose transport system permease protein